MRIFIVRNYPLTFEIQSVVLLRKSDITLELKFRLRKLFFTRPPPSKSFGILLIRQKINQSFFISTPQNTTSVSASLSSSLSVSSSSVSAFSRRRRDSNSTFFTRTSRSTDAEARWSVVAYAAAAEPENRRILFFWGLPISNL